MPLIQCVIENVIPIIKFAKTPLIFFPSFECDMKHSLICTNFHCAKNDINLHYNQTTGQKSNQPQLLDHIVSSHVLYLNLQH